MADTLLGGRLVERLTQLRGEGLSFDEISRHLFAEARVTTSGETCRSWARQLGIEPPLKRAS